MNATFHDKDGQPWKEGDVYTRPKYADTLEALAEAGDKGEKNLGFYTGRVGKDLVADLHQLGGLITLRDLEDYEARWVKPVQVSLESLNSTFYSVPPPGSGAILAYILNMLDLYQIKPKDDNPLLFHRIVETFKWAYALRTELGDGAREEAIKETIEHLVANLTSEQWARDRFEQIKDDSTVKDAKHYGAVYYTPEDHGTAHVSIIAASGDAVSVTNTINLYFGSLIMSPRTGILLNDEMDDFSAPNITNYFGVPPSPHNFIRPGKRPLSSMCPSLLIDKTTNQVRLAIGAAGGTKITTAVAQAIIRNQWLGEDIKSAIDARRLHHQLAPMVVSYEPGVPKEVLDSLEARGHAVSLVDKFGSVVVGIERNNDGELQANVDFRKAGAVAGY
jgi:gamma-glutamyltranspeptidase/glutathione hydrolase/leukotriene-C4 hydrolase